MTPLGNRLAAGEPEAFAALYEQCAARCHHYLVTLLRSRDEADEVLQNVFVRLVQHRESLAKVDNIAAYAFTIARREAIRFSERRNRESQGRAALTADELFLEAKSDDVQQRENAEIAAAALAVLGDDAREVVELKVYGRLTFREIAEVLDLPQGTVATRYRTALALLKDWFVRQPS